MASLLLRRSSAAPKTWTAFVSASSIVAARRSIHAFRATAGSQNAVLPRVGPAARQQPPKRKVHMQPTARLMRTSEHDHRAHTVTQRLRMIRNMPIELAPLAVVLIFAIIIAFYFGIRKFMTDKTLRLTRVRRDDK